MAQSFTFDQLLKSWGKYQWEKQRTFPSEAIACFRPEEKDTNAAFMLPYTAAL